MTHRSPRSNRRHHVTPLALLFLLATTVHAQLPDWSTLTTSSSATVKLEQNQAIVQDGPVVHAWSAVSRQWTSITASWTSAPVVNIRNEHCLVQDGPVYYEYSPRTGVFSAKIIASPNAVLVPIGSAQTWHDIIIEGNFVHAYFAITGHWETYAFASPPTVTNGRYCFVIETGTAVYGVSSFYGSLVPLAESGATVTGTWGNLALTETPGFVHGFSASRNTWSTLPTFAPVSVTSGNSQPACVAIEDGFQIAFFSGNTGTFAVIPASPSATIHIERGVGLIIDGTTAYGYSTLLGTYATLNLSAAANALVDQYYGVVDDGTSVHMYSAVRGVFAQPFAASIPQLVRGAQVALATTAGGIPSAVYSAYLNTWTNTPNGLVAPTPHVTASAVILEEATGGLYGYTMRGTSWTYQPTAPLNVAVAGSSPPGLAETFFAQQGNTLYTFNPHYGAWRSTTTNAPATLRRAHHNVLLAGDGTAAYAYGIWNDSWSTQPLSSGTTLTSSNSNAQVQSAFVRDGNQLHVYSGVDELSLIPEFPHFYRAATQGSIMRLDLAGEPGSATLLALSPFPANIPLSPAGTLRLDPNFLVVLAQPELPATGTTSVTFQIPSAPALSGVELHLQAAIVGSSGLYLTESVVATLL